MKRIGKKMCQVCKERISIGIIQKRYVCKKCYYAIQNLQTVNGYSRDYFKKRKIKLKVLKPSEIIKEVRKNHTIGSSQRLEVSKGML